MLRATFGSPRLRAAKAPAILSPPPWFKSQVASLLETLSTLTSTHPIRTIAFVAIIASTTYISLLESKLFEPPTSPITASGQLGLESLVPGSITLYTCVDTSWKWQVKDLDYKPDNHLVCFQKLSTLNVFQA